ncbi:MAG: GNAT family N-acetyltransferase [Pseudomonadota bacterium]
MTTEIVDIRSARAGDAHGLTRVHDEAWETAYRGLIPGIQLTKMIQRRGPVYWKKLAERRGSGLLVLAFDGTIAGYASFGPNRSRRVPVAGEIYELYLKPDYQGIGLGTRLFRAARQALGSAGLRGVCAWALDGNTMASAFYEARGGSAHAHGFERFGDTRLAKTAWTWPVRKN